MSSSSNQPEQDPKTKALNGYRRRLLEHRELDAKLKESKPAPFWKWSLKAVQLTPHH